MHTTDDRAVHVQVSRYAETYFQEAWGPLGELMKVRLAGLTDRRSVAVKYATW